MATSKTIPTTTSIGPLVSQFDHHAVFGYHAHIYYRNPQEREIAAQIRSQIDSLFDVQLGRWQDEPVGPHPLPMYQVSFTPEELVTFMPWLMSVRGGLSILIHVQTGKSDLLDHTSGACWLGEPLGLNTAIFD